MADEDELLQDAELERAGLERAYKLIEAAADEIPGELRERGVNPRLDVILTLFEELDEYPPDRYFDALAFTLDGLARMSSALLTMGTESEDETRDMYRRARLYALRSTFTDLRYPEDADVG